MPGYMAGSKCYGCRKPVGTDYLSHPRTDCKGDDGAPWGDAALCLCEDCATATMAFMNVGQFIDWRAITHPPEPPVPKYPPGSLHYRPEIDSDGEEWGTDHFVLTAEGDEVCTAPDAEAALLFAASPDLLAACELWDKGFTEGEEFTHEQFVKWVNDNRRAARAAIAKAKGQ